MSSEQVPLYVRLSADPHHRLAKAVAVSGKSKRQVIEDAVRGHLSDEGLVVGRVGLREETSEVLTLSEAAALLRIDESALRQAAQDAAVPGRQIGDEWRFSKVALLAWLGEAQDDENS
jgi:hypothetical protein